MTHFPRTSIALPVIAMSMHLHAATITLVGLANPQDTAMVSDYSLSGNTYTFRITNTAPVGVIANLGLSFGNRLRLDTYSTTAPFAYDIENDTFAPDFQIPLDFAMVGQDQMLGIAPGNTESYFWTLSVVPGSMLSGITAADIAAHQVVRFRLLPTASGTDAALATPEPATVGLVAILITLGMGRLHMRSRWPTKRATTS